MGEVQFTAALIPSIEGGFYRSEIVGGFQKISFTADPSFSKMDKKGKEKMHILP